MYGKETTHALLVRKNLIQRNTKETSKKLKRREAFWPKIGPPLLACEIGTYVVGLDFYEQVE